MRVVILTNRQGNQIALANKIAEKAEVAAIVFSKNIPRRKPDFAKRAKLSLNGLANRTIGREFVRVWFEMQKKYDALYPDLPTENVVRVENINDSATVQTIEKHAPDLIVVSGTNLVGKKVIEAAQKRGGIVNLHTGISPYVKGGPNCTNWCLAKNWFHLIGNTVMWLDLGIDTGNIVATEQTKLNGDETLFELHWKVMQHAHEIYVKSIERIGAGKEVPSVPQKEIAAGSHFNSVDWNALEMRRALLNFRRNYKKYFADAEKHRKLSEELRLFPTMNE
jgi:methionyl-tRNA formyltransferase